MEKPVTILLIAPPGAGKTIRVKELDQSTHINRDRITTSLLRKFGVDPRAPFKWEDYNRIDEALWISKNHYYILLDKLFRKRKPSIVIDHPPEGPTKDWIDVTAHLSKEAGRKVIVEGIWVDPYAALSRYLLREGERLDLTKDMPEIMNADRHVFLGWLNRYRMYPAQFLRAAQIADEAFLYDNNGASRKLIATWTDGALHAADPHSYAGFMGLQNLDLEAAHFKAKYNLTPTQNGHHDTSVEVTAWGFYGAGTREAPSFPAAVVHGPAGECRC